MPYELKRDDLVSVDQMGCFDVSLGKPISMCDFSDEAFAAINNIVDALQGPQDKLTMQGSITSESFVVNVGPKGTSRNNMERIYINAGFCPLPTIVKELQTLLYGPKSHSPSAGLNRESRKATP